MKQTTRQVMHFKHGAIYAWCRKINYSSKKTESQIRQENKYIWCSKVHLYRCVGYSTMQPAYVKVNDNSTVMVVVELTDICPDLIDRVMLKFIRS